MRIKFGDSAVFGREKDESLHGSLNAVMQSFDGQDVYPSVEEKAAHLLYFLVKNHSFVDGSKRIAAGESGYITASLNSYYDTHLFLLLPLDCESVDVVYSAEVNCPDYGVLEFSHPPETEFWLWIGPNSYSPPFGVTPNQFEYHMYIEGLTPPSAIQQTSWGAIKQQFK